MLRLVDVTKMYDYRPVLHQVNLSLEPGRLYVLQAPNGSGKTTLLQLMGGTLRPTEGGIFWGDHPLCTKDRRHLGAVLQAPLVYGDLSARENLQLFATLYGLPEPRSLAEQWVRRVRLETAGSVKVRSFSKGMLQRLAIARSLLHEPQVLLLDEPFDGLDVESVELVEALLAERRRHGTTIFMVTHEQGRLAGADECLTIRYSDVVPL